MRDYYPPFALLEAIYMSWFTFEFLVRIIVPWCTFKIMLMINCRHLTSFIYKSRAPEVSLQAGSWFTRRMFLCARIFLVKIRYMKTTTRLKIIRPLLSSKKSTCHDVQLNLHETDLLFGYLSHHLTWHCLLIYGFPPIFPSSCLLWS